MKKIITVLIVIGLLIGFGITGLTYFSDRVYAQAETCPDGGAWVKVDDINDQSILYTAPEGKLIAESCYKAGTELVYDTYEPPVDEVTLTSSVLNPVGNNFQDISHASFRLVDGPTETVTPTETTTPTETGTPEVTETPEETEPPETATPTETPEETEPPETATPTETPEETEPPETETPPVTETPTETETPTQTETPIVTDPPETETPTETETPSETEVATEEPTPAATPTDMPAGGVGPSSASMFLPWILGISGLLFVGMLVRKATQKGV